MSKTVEICGYHVSWWDGEYEGECELPAKHKGPHYDGMSCFTDELDEVEIKSLPLPEVKIRINYYKPSGLIYYHNAVLYSGAMALEFQPEADVKIVAEIYR